MSDYFTKHSLLSSVFQSRNVANIKAMLFTFLSPEVLFYDNRNSPASKRKTDNRKKTSQQSNLVLARLEEKAPSSSDFTEWSPRLFCSLTAHMLFCTACISASTAEFHFQMSKAPFRKHTSQPLAYKIPTALQLALTDEKTFSDLFTKDQSFKASDGI